MQQAQPARPGGLPTRAFANAMLWFAVFLGGFVFYEPAPYELFLAGLIAGWFLFGMRVPRSIGPLVVLLVVFLVGGVLSTTQSKVVDLEPMYIAVTGFLCISACFYAALVGEEPDRLQLITSAWIAAALATTFLGILGYLGLTGTLFAKYGRAAGGFEDPNVFGPFLVFPMTVLVQRVLVNPGSRAVLHSCAAVFLLFGIFLSGSRAAWGLAVFTLAGMALLLFITESRAAVRTRYVTLAILGAVAAAVLLAVALSIPAIYALFEERAKLDQSYDVGHLGRFARHAIGLNMMLDHPLGIGALEFRYYFPEDEHDIWLKTLTTYGWMGFVAYFALVVWTLKAGASALFRSGPLQHTAQVAYVVFLGHILTGTVIDIDHWRHVYLLIGIIWGILAFQRSEESRRLADQTPDRLARQGRIAVAEPA